MRADSHALFATPLRPPGERGGKARATVWGGLLRRVFHSVRGPGEGKAKVLERLLSGEGAGSVRPSYASRREGPPASLSSGGEGANGLLRVKAAVSGLG